jgi:hypothetical protein
MYYRAGAAGAAWRLLISMIAKGCAPESGAKVFAIMNVALLSF